MKGSLVDFPYWHNVAPAEPTALTRANAADGYPNALTPLSQDLVVTYEDRGAVEFFARELKGQDPATVTDRYLFSLWGYVYLSADAMASIGDTLPGSSRQSVYEQYLGLSPDPAFIAPRVPWGQRLSDVRGLIPLLRSMNTVAAGIPQRVQRLKSAAVAARRDGSVSEADCLDWLRDLEALMIDAWACLMAGAGVASANFSMADKVIGKVARGASPDLVNRLHVGLGGDESAESGHAVRHLAAMVRARPALRAAVEADRPWSEVMELDADFALEAQTVIDRFAYRATPELELAELSWRQQPQQLLDVVRREAARPAVVDHAQEIRVAAEAQLHRTVALPLRPLTTLLLRRSREQMAHRENSKRPIVLIFDEIRRLLSVAGPLLCRRGVLAEETDGVFLTLAELDACLGGAAGPGLAELEHRKVVHARCRALTVPELVLAGPDWLIDLPDDEIIRRGMLVPEREVPDRTSLTGLAASPGQVTGRARVILDPDDDFEAGDVLFTRTVDPGWSAILSCAGGIVLDMGGPLSHGAVVARELGIPCVVNVKVGTTSVVDGSTVTIDGSSGTVRLDV